MIPVALVLTLTMTYFEMVRLKVAGERKIQNFTELRKVHPMDVLQTTLYTKKGTTEMVKLGM